VDLFVRTGRILYLYWVMTALQMIGKIGTDAVKELRLQKLRNGLPFMIDSDDLENNQCYLEFPDGTIKLVCLTTGAREFTKVRTLSANEARSLRVKEGLSHS
jgi:hypothetical protein